jgi:hypothetical protein
VFVADPSLGNTPGYVTAIIKKVALPHAHIDTNDTPQSTPHGSLDSVRKKIKQLHAARGTKAAQMLLPTPEHYLPLLYVLGAAGPMGHYRTHVARIRGSR